MQNTLRRNNDMSVVIVGGNERMVRRYKDICSEYNCDSKIFTTMNSGIISRIGRPDLLIFFTSTMSHKMLQTAMTQVGTSTQVMHCKSSSCCALRAILKQHAG